MPFRVLPTAASTKAEHGVRSRILLSASDARALKLSSGDPCWIDKLVVCTVGVLNTIKSSTCMLSSEALELCPSGSMIQLTPILEDEVEDAEVCKMKATNEFSPSTLAYLSKRWEHSVVSAGTRLGAFLGGVFRVFEVESTGNCAMRITKATKIIFNSEAAINPNEHAVVVAVGGLQQEYAQLEDLIATWIESTTTQHQQQSKFPPPRSAIIFGPSGSGKTVLAKQVTARFTTDQVFFVDDVDLIVDEDDDVFSTAGNRFVLATNSSGAISEQVRKMFDCEVEIPPPNALQRTDILRLLLLPTNNNTSPEDIARVAARAHGFVGADLKLLVNQALNSPPPISAQSMLQAMKTVKPSCLREAIVTIPNVRWDDIGGMEQVKSTIRESVELPLKHPEAFLRLGIRPPSGILLYGPPGCSKTLLAKAVASESEMNFIAVKGPELLSKWVGDSEKAIQATFRRARMSKPCVVFFDEIDALAVQRGADGGGVSHRVTSQLLQELDGIEPRSGVIVLCATNRPDLLDVALLRPGRIDRLVYVPPPDATARMEILKINLRALPHSFEDSKLQELNTEGFSGAEVASICRNAALLALEQECTEVDFSHLQTATARVVPQISSSVLNFYVEFKAKLR